MMEQFEKSQNTDEQTAQKWFDHHAEIVVIKHGGEGSITYTKSGASYQGGTFKTKVLKTFGAGDSYASTFIYIMLQKRDIPKEMDYGSTSAAIVISKNRCTESMTTLV